METLNIFIDTSIFRNKAFDLKNDSLKKLKELGQNEQIFIYTTSITKRECDKNLLEIIDEQASRINKLNIHLENVSQQAIDFNELKETRLKNWTDFIIQSKTNEIPIYSGSVEEVFNRYFDNLPPFDSKNKKNEFPDAFVLETLMNWCEVKGEKLYVISSDKPFSNYGNSEILTLNSIEEFLDLYSKHNEAKLYELAQSSFELLKDEIINKITESFEIRHFVVPDLWDAEVNDVEVEQIILHQPYFINVTQDFCQIDIDIDIHFSASLSYDDPDMIYRDSDTREFVSLKRDQESITASITTTISIEINFSKTENEMDSVLQYVWLPNEIEERISSENFFDDYRIISRK